MEALHLPRTARVPNSAWPVLVHRAALPPAAPAGAYEALFARHGWTGAWRDGVYPFTHFHSTAHEVLGVHAGRAVLRIGGDAGRDLAVAAGDVLVLPAGTGHRRIEAGPDFGVVGAYADGRDWDLIRADTATDADLARAGAAIAALPVPELDPATGAALRELWAPAPDR